VERADVKAEPLSAGMGEPHSDTQSPGDLACLRLLSLRADAGQEQARRIARTCPAECHRFASSPISRTPPGRRVRWKLCRHALRTLEAIATLLFSPGSAQRSAEPQLNRSFISELHHNLLALPVQCSSPYQHPRWLSHAGSHWPVGWPARPRVLQCLSRTSSSRVPILPRVAGQSTRICWTGLILCAEQVTNPCAPVLVQQPLARDNQTRQIWSLTRGGSPVRRSLMSAGHTTATRRRS